MCSSVTRWSVRLCILALVVSSAPFASDPGELEVVSVDPSAVTQIPPGSGGGDEETGPPPPPSLYRYHVETSLSDPDNCVMPLAAGDGEVDAYLNLAAFGIGPQAAVVGDQITFGVNFACGSFDFFGTDYPVPWRFTDDAFSFFDPSTDGGHPAHTPIPIATDPNNMQAVLWRDFTVVFDGVRGVSLANLTSGGTPVGALIEWDGLEPTGETFSDCCEADFTGPGCEDPVCETLVCAIDPFCCGVVWDGSCAALANGVPECGCTPSRYDVEVFAFCEDDPTPGAYEYIFAYNNITGPVDIGTIGVEDVSGTVGNMVAFDNATVGNGEAICFDLIPPTIECNVTCQSPFECAGADTTVDLAGSGSSPQGSVVTEWSGPCPIADPAAGSTTADCPGTGDFTFTLTVTIDADGNGVADPGEPAESCDLPVTVQDTTPPTCALPDPIVVECNTAGGVSGNDQAIADLFGGVVVDDACGGIALGGIQPDLFPVACGDETAAIPVTAVVDDGAGLQGLCVSSVTVVDTTPPDVSCGAAVVPFVDENDETEDVLQIAMMADDICCDCDIDAVIDIGCIQVSVRNEQLVDLGCFDADEFTDEDPPPCDAVFGSDGLLEIETVSANLIVNAKDCSGNDDDCIEDLCLLVPDDEADDELPEEPVNEVGNDNDNGGGGATQTMSQDRTLPDNSRYGTTEEQVKQNDRRARDKKSPRKHRGR